MNDNGSGTNAGVIGGIQWSANDIVTKGRVGRAIMCVPLGGGVSVAINNAVNSASAQGVPVIVPAGSSGASSLVSPIQTFKQVLTRAATD